MSQPYHRFNVNISTIIHLFLNIVSLNIYINITYVFTSTISLRKITIRNILDRIIRVLIFCTRMENDKECENELDLNKPKQADFILNEAPEVPDVAYDLQVLQSLRRLIRAADIFSRRLIKQHKVTGPQLMCLHKLLELDGLTVSELSKAIYLSPSTVVGILDRLEKQKLVTRIRSSTDRRKVLIHVTQEGRDLVVDAPSPLQEALRSGLTKLDTHKQKEIADNIASLVSMLEIDDLDAAPILETDTNLNYTTDYQEPQQGY